MQTYIALLRGINVGNKQMKMADLKILFEELGFADVVTYIQSGNVVFASKSKNGLTEKISKGIQKSFGFEVPVLVKTVSEIEGILAACPFSEEKKKASYFILLNEPPVKNMVEKVSQETYPDEEFNITDNCVYLFASKGYGVAKCNNNFFEKKLGVAATTRNYRTLAKLIELAK
ncbi:MAG: hypothetical protein CL524_14150 [Aequorivita sp.]|nr:hypothetical protein [Aequorivita sp.]MBF30897.1 hypothetical protein [Aequorivita sp.]|tara:strand:- start:68320 stop:68841 length:522 start_codon:yes stop_codon:yes gene_type:complete